ncbi:MAG: class I SAM-dependent methyltransferase, partial [Verrucomicrobiales bacterium]
MSANYTSLEAELHDAFWNAEDSPELAWLDALLKQEPGEALEIGSGSGRLLLPLLQNGHQVEGLEPSRAMLELCRAEAERLGLRPTLHEGDMAGFHSENRYDHLLIPAFTFQLSEQPESDLRKLRKVLNPDGTLYLTTFVPFAEIDGELPEGEWYPDHDLDLPGGGKARIQTRHEIDHEQQILSREHHYQLQDSQGIR